MSGPQILKVPSLPPDTISWSSGKEAMSLIWPDWLKVRAAALVVRVHEMELRTLALAADQGTVTVEFNVVEVSHWVKETRRDPRPSTGSTRE